MIFMSQSGLVDPVREAQWDAWYIEHLRTMLTVPGIFSAQRFRTDTPGYSPSLAIYGVAGAEVFDDPHYRSVRGMGEWLPLIDRRHYKRNLFAGLEHAPAVPLNGVLVLADRESEDAALADLNLIWLKCVGIDRSTPYRGIAVASGAPRVPPGVAIYRPVTGYLTPLR